MAIPKDIRVEVADKKMVALIIGGTQLNQRVKDDTEKLEGVKAEIRDMAAAKFAEGPDGALFEIGPGLPSVAVTKSFRIEPVSSEATAALAGLGAVSSKIVHYDVPEELFNELLTLAKPHRDSTLLAMLKTCRREDVKISTAGFWNAVKGNSGLRKLANVEERVAVSFVPAESGKKG